MHQLKTIIVVIVLFILIAGFWAVKTSLPDEDPNISIAVSRTPLSAPIYIADSLGYFKSAGLNVELIESNGGNLSFQLMMNGTTDFATSSESVIMFNGFKQTGFENLATFVRSYHDVKVITKASLNIHSAKDLKDRKVALIKGSASEYFLDMFLAIESVDSSHIKRVNLPANEMASALQNNQVDAIVVWEPFAFKTFKLLGDDSVLLSSSNLYELTFNLLSKKQTSEKNAKTEEKVLEVLIKATEYINANEAEAQGLIRERLGLDQSFIKWIWNDYLYNVSLNRSLLLSLENEAHWAIDSGLTDQKVIPNYRALINPKPLLNVSPHSVSF